MSKLSVYQNGERVGGSDDFQPALDLAREVVEPKLPADIKVSRTQELLARVWHDGGIDYTHEARAWR